MRGESRLLVVDRRGRAADGGDGPGDRFEMRCSGTCSSLIPAGDLLVLNSTRVRHARLLGTRPSGGAAEVLLIHPGTDDTWIAMGKPGSALRAGEADHARARRVRGDGRGAGRRQSRRAVRGRRAPRRRSRGIGQLPLPPYITHAPGSIDEERYQTVYARARGIGRGADRGAALHQCAAGSRSRRAACRSPTSTSRWARARSSRSRRTT